MADFQDAGFRLLSFKYTPPQTEKEQATEEKTGHGTTIEERNGDLPSLSLLLTSLQEIQSSSNDTDKGIMNSPSEELLEKGKDNTASISRTKSLTEFHLFNDLPTEIRLKIWDLTFLPRVVEVRPPRPATFFKGQWQSGCSNPAQLAVSIEAREAALAHCRIPFPLVTTIARHESSTSITTTQLHDDTVRPVPFHPLFCLNGVRPGEDSDSREVRRTLYIAPEHDTVCCLGQDWDPVSISDVMQKLREADPLGFGIRRLGTSVSAWGSHGGNVAQLKDIGRIVFPELDQFTLFMYGEREPPRMWWTRGWAMMDGEAREEYRREGNRCVLVSCESGSAWEAYKIWFAGRGRGFWNGGDVLRFGRKNNEVRFMDLEFEAGW